MRWKVLVLFILLIQPQMVQGTRSSPPCDLEAKAVARITDMEGNELSKYTVENADVTISCYEPAYYYSVPDTFQINRNFAGFIDEENGLNLVNFNGEGSKIYIPNRTHYAGNNYVIRTNQNNMLLVDEDILSNYTSIRIHIQGILQNLYVTHNISAEQMHGFATAESSPSTGLQNSTITRFYDAVITSDRTSFLLFKVVSKLKYLNENNTVKYTENRFEDRIVKIENDGTTSFHELENRYQSIHLSTDDKIYLSTESKTYLYTNDEKNETEIWDNPSTMVSGGYLVGNAQLSKGEFYTPLLQLSTLREIISYNQHIDMIKDDVIMHLYIIKKDEDYDFIRYWNLIIPWAILVAIMIAVRKYKL